MPNVPGQQPAYGYPASGPIPSQQPAPAGPPPPFEAGRAPQAAQSYTQPGAPPPPGEGQPGIAPDTPAAPESPTHPAAGFDDRGQVRRGRVSVLWVGLIAVAVVLIVLIIFIAQNLTKVTIHFLGLSGHFPIGLIALIAAIVGLLVAAVPGSIRIMQLRKALKINTPPERRTA